MSFRVTVDEPFVNDFICGKKSITEHAALGESHCGAIRPRAAFFIVL